MGESESLNSDTYFFDYKEYYLDSTSPMTRTHTTVENRVWMKA